MTPEQKQRIETDSLLQRLVETPAGERIRMKCGAADLRSVITDLLSLVKSQEAGGGDAVLRQGVITRIEREIRLWHNDTVTMACADMLAELKQMPAVPDAATSMRSACVEELKRLARERVGQSKPYHKDHEYDQAAAFVLLQAAEKLESLSIEKPREQE